MIVVDTSALVAIALGEPDRHRYQTALENSNSAYLSSINYVELGVVLTQRRIVSDAGRLDAWLTAVGVSVRDDAPLATPALQAYLRYGKGRHPARLNLGDCFAYALAKRLDAPLLYKGDDFALTDVRAAG